MQLDGKYPGIRKTQREIETQANRRRAQEGEAYVRSPLTGRKHVADAGREYALMNYLIQGTAGEILKMKMIELDHSGLGRYLVLPVHDEFDLDVPTHMLPDVMATLGDIMNDEHMLSVPVTATTSIGQSWGSVEDV
jgi:DNA polymerase I-like protein with 3'-5' exonuclease and polymerase domains